MPARTDAEGPIVVTTAMRLSDAARQRLSDLLGPGYVVVDIKRAPSTANVVLAPMVSQDTLGSLRSMFPSARILFAEIDDAELGIRFDGPMRHVLESGADGYFVAGSLSGISTAIEGQARLQLSGDTRPSLPQIGPSASAAEPAPPPGSASSPLPAGAPPAVIWLNAAPGVRISAIARLVRQRHPGLRVLDTGAIDRLMGEVLSEAVDDPASLRPWRALVGETAVQLVEHYAADLLVPVRLFDRRPATELFVHVDSEGLEQRHLLLHADRTDLQHPVSDPEDAGAVAEQSAELDRYERALPWLKSVAEVVETHGRTLEEIAAAVLALIGRPVRRPRR